MPKDAEDDEDHKDKHGYHGTSLTAPIRKTTMEPAKNHPQRLVLIKREQMKPSENLEAWFEIGLVKQKILRKDGTPSSNTYCTGARPLPIGYDGCDESTTLIRSMDNGIFIWPIRVSIHCGACNKIPWTLYHYTYKESFEKFHKIFHDMGNLEPEEASRELVQLMQADYQERVPNPTNINSKGEPQ